MKNQSFILNKEMWEEPQLLELSVKNSQLDGNTADDGDFGPSISE